MIRFLPDTWRDWVLRPLAMAAPDSWVYTEVSAPDFRFAAATLLAALLFATWWHRRSRPANRRQLLALALLTFASFNIWMWTTGNGRYLGPYLLLIGPLCVGLIWAMPATASLKGSAVALLVAIQGLALAVNSPWNQFDSLQWLAWTEPPYMHLNAGEEASKKDTTYVTLSNQTLSLVAPMFDASSRWLNLSAFNGMGADNSASQYVPVRRMLADARRLKLFQRANVSEMQDDSLQPTQRAVSVLNATLASHKLAMVEPTDCLVLRSSSLGMLTSVDSELETSRKELLIGRAGFWVCSLRYPVQEARAAALTEVELAAKQVFEKIEQLCPRFFPAGQSEIRMGEAGSFTRVYPSSDSILTMTADGVLYFKYARALNPERIGRKTDILVSGFRMDCVKFRGRSGLPWEREI